MPDASVHGSSEYMFSVGMPFRLNSLNATSSATTMAETIATDYQRISKLLKRKITGSMLITVPFIY